MLGRVRASSIGSLELLEMERSPSKIIKDDSFSIYESTLLKLKQGSHNNPRCSTEDSTNVDPSSVMPIDSSEEALTTDAEFSSKQHLSKNMSILHFFRRSNQAKEVMDFESDSSTVSGVSPTSSC